MNSNKTKLNTKEDFDNHTNEKIFIIGCNKIAKDFYDRYNKDYKIIGFVSFDSNDVDKLFNGYTIMDKAAINAEMGKAIICEEQNKTIIEYLIGMGIQYDIYSKKNKIDQLVSIVIPVFNSEKYLEECLNSVINQTYKNIEIIIVDNNSTDNSIRIAKKYQDFDKRIILLEQKHKGVPLTRKLGIESANGDYICNIDSDDYIDPRYVERLLNKAIETNADIVQCSFKCEGIKEDEYIFGDYSTYVNDNGYEILLKWIHAEKCLGSQLFTKLFRAKLIKDVLQYISMKINEGEDQMFFLYYIKKARIIISISDVLYHYRYRLDSLSHKKSFKWLLNELVMIYRLSNIMYNEYPKLDVKEIERWKKGYRRMRINDYIEHLKTK